VRKVFYPGRRRGTFTIAKWAQLEQGGDDDGSGLISQEIKI